MSGLPSARGGLYGSGSNNASPPGPDGPPQEPSSGWYYTYEGGISYGIQWDHFSQSERLNSSIQISLDGGDTVLDTIAPGNRKYDLGNGSPDFQERVRYASGGLFSDWVGGLA